MENLTPPQVKILSTLLFNPRARFKELNREGLNSDYFSYYVRLLLKDGLIQKEGYFYSLTSLGKMAAGKIDTVSQTVEKQPKVSVILIPHKKVEGRDMFLIQQRTKEPYFGYWGFMAGKVKFGETLEQTAARELKEEAGLTGKFRFCYEIHEMVYDKATGQQLEDKFFHAVEAYGLTGDLSETTQEGRNKFVTAREFLNITPKYHNENDLLNWYLKMTLNLKKKNII